ncbi:MAG: hypothetical protein COA97_02355 [Flavobacteriales bacterium]|nr:MAG: hypothetical protein COA97_02355 [Flavobacteriales bacterium]
MLFGLEKENTINMKKITLITLGLFLSAAIFAQQKPNYGATPEDSITCIESLIYKDYLKNEPILALDLWRVAYRVCPQSQKTLYINGVRMYKALAKKEKEAAQQKAYLDTVFSIYNQRIEMFGQKGLVLGQKGQAMLSTKQDKEKTFEVLNEAITITGNKTQSGTLVAIMFTIINMEKAGKKTKGEVVAMFEKTLAICAFNIAKYTKEEESNITLVNTAKSMDKDGKVIEHNTYSIGDGSKKIIKIFVDGKFDRRISINNKPLRSKLDKYVKAQEKINNVTSPYLDCAVLIPLATKNFEANKENLDWLRITMRLLKKNKCYKTDDGAVIFGKVAEAYFKLEPSANGAAGIGTLYLGKKDWNKAIEFFKKAIDMAETDDEKTEHILSVAKAYSYSRSFAQARTYALKAISLKKGWGAPYILIGDCYAQSSKKCNDGELGRYGAYWAAVDKYKKAKAVDTSVASLVNKKIASITSRYPATKDVFFYNKKNGDAYTVKCWINETTTIKTK